MTELPIPSDGAVRDRGQPFAHVTGTFDALRRATPGHPAAGLSFTVAHTASSRRDSHRLALADPRDRDAQFLGE